MEGDSLWSSPIKVVLTFGSFATEIHESCQVRNEAALSETFRVPKGCLNRANCIGNVCGLAFDIRCAVFNCGFIIKRAKHERNIMAYQALYRKWRPNNFNDVKGQEHIVTTLQNQIKLDRIGHAYLFCGTRGTGKTTVAKIFAKAVNCESPANGNPCGECSVCKAIAAGTSMNVIEIDAASNNGVDNIRQIREEVQYSPTEGKFKVYIIDEVHMLSIGAFNALLKTLEEPPSYVIFILATTEAHMIPITILSRCQRYDFHRITIDIIADRLSELMKEEQVVVEERAIRYVAKAADGSMRDALSLLDQCIAFYLGQEITYENVLKVLGAVDTEVFESMLKCILASDVTGCMQLIENIIMKGKEITQFISDFVWYLRNMLLVKTTDDMSALQEIIDMSSEHLTKLADTANKIDDGLLMRYIRVLSDLLNDIKHATQKRIKAEVAFIKLCRPSMERENDVIELTARVSALENQLEKADKNLNEKLQTIVSKTDFFSETPNLKIDREHTAYNEENIQAEKERVVNALPDDIKEIAKKWTTIVHSIEEPLLAQHLKQAHVTLAQDNKSLEIMVESTVAYGALSREEDKAWLENIIEERTGFHVDIIVTKLKSNEDFQNRFIDITELVHMEIEIDDKEDLI